MLRRDLLKTAMLGSAALASVGTAFAQNAKGRGLDALADDLNRELFANDGLARPIPSRPVVSDLAKGLDRTLVLGGGCEYYVAWYCGFFH